MAVARRWLGLRVVPATPPDLEIVRSILTEAASWAAAQGVVGLWKVPYPAEWVAPSLERNEVFLAYLRTRPVGTLTLAWADPKIWGDRPDDAGYVHRLATRRDPSLSGLGVALLDWADARIASAGRRFLRLDTLSSQVGLRSYYLRLGFRIVGQSENLGSELVLLERPVKSSDAFRPSPASGTRAA